MFRILAFVVVVLAGTGCRSWELKVTGVMAEYSIQGGLR